MLDKKALGATIKKLRKEKKLKQIEVSTITNLSRNYISDIENGRYSPSLDAILKLAVCVGLDLNTLKNDGNTSFEVSEKEALDVSY
ncbi:iduronate sulfatase [Paenibacillus sp. FSL P4-0081]|uniref:helix-turn-helix domain-containing protein n=1 Tax=Paenibacillus sp. FSL P4-0081 TaxID=1536769 RepID=UPI0004F7FA8F|nr:helix-turn-helix transcriptional regulator [Paenibacillus sp. FSL P4-0081]AIQ29320.1 iduronate sulfatase [Paenibacillus sp. FSL P4-0081]